MKRVNSYRSQGKERITTLKEAKRGAKEITGVFMGTDHHAQGIEWLFPNILAPFQAEYELGPVCGTLSNEWMEGMRQKLAWLTDKYGEIITVQPERTQRSGSRKRDL